MASPQIPSVPSSAPPTSRRSPVLRFSTDSMAITPDGSPKSDAVELGVPGPAAAAPDGAGTASLAPRARARSEEVLEEDKKWKEKNVPDYFKKRKAVRQ